MLASIGDKPFDNDEWIFEVKWDGYRAVAEIKNGDLRLYSRNGLSFMRLYPTVALALMKIEEDIVLDGEIVVLNDNNKPDFQKLQQFGDHQNLPIQYYVFDCLSYRGKSLTNLPLTERKKIAQEVIPPSDIIKYSDHVRGNGTDFFKRIIKMDLEGMIAKRANSLYYTGRRSNDWLKIKNHNTQEAIITGYTAPRRSRPYFGALVLGIRNENGKLQYIGHTGTGFTNDLLKEIYNKLQPLKRKTSPFDKKIPVNSQVTWVEPVLTCQLKFTEITADGILRHPVFMGLRIDKNGNDPIAIDKTDAKKKITKSLTAKLSGKSAVRKDEEITIQGHTLKLTNKQKLYWPDEQITKGDVIEYYNNVHKVILPYLKDRPQSLRRNPNGVTDQGFFQKDAGGEAPAWVRSVPINAESAHRMINYILCNDLATLTYLNNLGCIELNPWNSRVSKLDYPDYLIMDIDPGDDNTFSQVIDTALAIKDILDKAGAKCYCKTSGASGLHIYIPLRAQYTYDQTRTFAEVIALLTVEQLPRITTVERTLAKRNGRIYVDYLQNKKGQTLASVYSLRPVPGATVSTPLLWSEVKPGLHPSQFTIHTISSRLEKVGDLFHGVLTEKINLKKCLKNLGA